MVRKARARAAIRHSAGNSRRRSGRPLRGRRKRREPTGSGLLERILPLGGGMLRHPAPSIASADRVPLFCFVFFLSSARVFRRAPDDFLRAESFLASRFVSACCSCRNEPSPLMSPRRNILFAAQPDTVGNASIVFLRRAPLEKEIGCLASATKTLASAWNFSRPLASPRRRSPLL